MKRNSLLTAGAAVAIVAVAAVGGYFIDKMPADQAQLAMQTPAPATSMGDAMIPAKKPMTTAALPGVTGAVSVPQPPPGTRSQAMTDTLPDRAMVAVSGTVTDKKGNTLTVKEGSGSVRVVVREDMPRPREITRVTRTVDKIGVGLPVTVYGQVRTTDDETKVYADAVYDPSTRTLYKLNDKPIGNKPAEQLTSADLSAQYTPMGKLTATKTATAKVTVTKTTTSHE